ncbi:MAG: hypothetical protein ACYSTS_19750 [Planctomycetota bacterium]|jgi:hypothetical protein
MSQEQTYKRCKYFTYKSCPHIDKELMKDLIDRVSVSGIVRSYGIKLDYGKAGEVDKKYCSTCDAFKSNKS